MFAKKRMYMLALGSAVALLMSGCGTAGVSEVASTQSATSTSPPAVKVTLAPAESSVTAKSTPTPLETNEAAPPAIVQVPLPAPVVVPGGGVTVSLPGCETIRVVPDNAGVGTGGGLYIGVDTPTKYAADILASISPDQSFEEWQKCLDDAIATAKKDDPSTYDVPVAKVPLTPIEEGAEVAEKTPVDLCPNLPGMQDVVPGGGIASVPRGDDPNDRICRDKSWMSEAELADAIYTQ